MKRIVKGKLLLCAISAFAAPAQIFTTLQRFDGRDGSGPSAALVQATDGDFYGTTYYGGANVGTDGFAAGTVFKMTPSGMLTTLYSFCGESGCTDGKQPAGIIQAVDGNFYGTTYYGGANGHGTVFKITPRGQLTTLYRFCSQGGMCPDGFNPAAGLVQATDGNFYGTTLHGGVNDNEGTVFKITPGGTLTTIYSFCSQSRCMDGKHPYAALVQAADGDLYGTTSIGGANVYYGTVFKISLSGALTTLYSFCAQSGCTDGEIPQAALVQVTSGDFYGTTAYGGANCVVMGCGTVFKISSDGMLTTLYSFCSQGGCMDGAEPFTALVQANDGNLYGTTTYGGACVQQGCGTVFKITPGGALTTLHNFCLQSGCPDGIRPYAGLIQATNGRLYGTTQQGGEKGNDGTVFEILAP